MHKLILAVIVPLAIGGVFTWYDLQARQAVAQANDFENWARQQKLVSVEFVVSAPNDATLGEQILYLCDATLGAWDPGALPLERRADGKYHATVELMSGIEHAFTISRGTRLAVECGSDGNALSGRAFRVDGPAKIAVPIAGWKDDGAGSQQTPR